VLAIIGTWRELVPDHRFYNTTSISIVYIISISLLVCIVLLKGTYIKDILFLLMNNFIFHRVGSIYLYYLYNFDV